MGNENNQNNGVATPTTGANTPPNNAGGATASAAASNVATGTNQPIDEKGLITGIVDGIKGVFTKPGDNPDNKGAAATAGEPAAAASKTITMTPEEFEAAVVAKSKEVASEQITNALGTEKLHREVNAVIDEKYKDFAIGALKDSTDLKTDLDALVEKYPEFKKAEKVAGVAGVSSSGQAGVYLSKDAAALVMAERNRK